MSAMSSGKRPFRTLFLGGKMEILSEPIAVSEIEAKGNKYRANPVYVEAVERAIALDDGFALVIVCESTKEAHRVALSIGQRCRMRSIPLEVTSRKERVFLYRKADEQKTDSL
jgi:hypothetical protein